MINRKAAAWLVHFYTATGGILGMIALFAAVDGQIENAFILLLIALVIDATDGLLARYVRVREVLPNFDGAMVDNIIDFLTYIWVPVFIIGATGLLPHIMWIGIPVLAGLYAYGQTEMKTPDDFFLGFPSYWNIVALYMYWLQPSPVIAVLMLVIPGVLTFIPTRYLYPSKNRTLSKTTWVLATIWLLLITYMLLQPQADQTLILASLYFPVYYFAASFYIDFQVRRNNHALASS
jgi:phosphatidylcholine synthase